MPALMRTKRGGRKDNEKRSPEIRSPPTKRRMVWDSDSEDDDSEDEDDCRKPRAKNTVFRAQQRVRLWKQSLQPR